MKTTKSISVEVFSCPDCVGILSEERRQGRLRTFVCQVGHRFSTHSLLLAKERELEKALWSAAVLLRHTAMVYDQLLDEQRWTRETQRALSRRVREATQQFHTLVRMIEQTHEAQ